MFRTIILLGLFFSLSGMANAAKNSVIANVNGVPIKKSDFDETYRQNQLYVTHKKLSKKKVLDDLIHRALGIQRAKKNKLDKNPVVLKKMEDIMYHAQISKDLEPKLKKIVITDKEVESYYKKFPEYHTAHILFRVQINPSEKEYKAAMEQAFKVHNTLKKSPNSFPELANKFSQTAAAPSGGDVGHQPAIRMAPEYFDAIKGKKVGYITHPVRSQYGYHIIKVLGVKAYADISKPLYKKIVYDIKRDKVLEGYYKELRKNAKVSINKKLLK